MKTLTAPGALAEAMAMGETSGYELRARHGGYRARLAETLDLWEAAQGGNRLASMEFHRRMAGMPSMLQEGHSTSDFPLLFGDTLSRSLARRYAVAGPVWQGFAARQVNRDFRAARILEFIGSGRRLPRVPEWKEYTAREFTEAGLTTTLAKYGERVQWSWEMSVNDDLGAFDNAPQVLADSAVVTEDYLATSVLVAAAGPKAWLGTPATTALTRDNLQAAINTLVTRTDTEGNRLQIPTPVLVIPEALNLTAQNILNTVEIRTTVSGVETLTRGNGLSRVPQVVVNPYLSAIDETADADQTWYLLAGPSDPRPSVYVTFLRGYESPDLRVQADAGMALGGGQLPASAGSFTRDTVEYRVRHVVGGNQGFTGGTFVSTGP